MLNAEIFSVDTRFGASAPWATTLNCSAGTVQNVAIAQKNSMISSGHSVPLVQRSSTENNAINAKLSINATDTRQSASRPPSRFAHR